jgi:hypothetical protein
LDIVGIVQISPNHAFRAINSYVNYVVYVNYVNYVVYVNYVNYVV